jgi:transposase InsO family protein
MALGGMNDARNKPARASVASHCASAMSFLRPGTALTCRALTTHATIPTASSATNGLFQYTPVLSITTTSGWITYIATDEGWLFLAVVIDLFSRQVVGWSLQETMTRGIVIDALRMAWFKRHPDTQAGLIFHSDRGSQYASHDFRDALKEYGITSSMSRKGDCWDNACSETLFGSLKVERLHGQRLKTRRQAKDEIVAWLLWYNSI